jgi:hypothetical protein
MATTKLNVGTICAVVVASVVTPLVVQHEAQARLRDCDEALQHRADQVAGLQMDNERLANLLAQPKNPRSLSDNQFGELLRLRGEVGRLRKDVQELMQSKTAVSAAGSDVIASKEKLWSERVNQLKQWLEVNPSEQIPELQYLTDSDWLNSIHPNTLETSDEYGRAMSSLRANAETRIMDRLMAAFLRFSQSHNGQLPTDLAQLTSYLDSPLADAILQRYEILPATNLVSELQGFGDWVITQKAPVNEKLDVRFANGLTGGTMADSRVTNRWVLVH